MPKVESVFVNNVLVIARNLDDFSISEAKNYIDFVKCRIGEFPTEITVTACSDGMVDIDYTVQHEKFERIRRITGYLTGDMSTWNNAKRAEEHERVKHL